MSMTVSTGDDADELDDDLDEDRDDDEQDDDEDERPARKSKAKADPDDDEDEDDDDKSPEDLKAEIKRLRASLTKANSSGNRRRQQLKEMRAAQKALESKEDDEDEDDDADEKPKAKQVVGLDAKAAQRLVTKAVSRRERELQEEHARDLIDTRFESALIKAGVSEKNIRLLMREVDHDELELDPKTRRVDGIDEETDRLRSEFPDLFKAPKSARRRINGGDDRESSSKRKALSATEKQVLQLTGRPR